MKVLLSSKFLSHKLNSIDFDKNRVMIAYLDESYLGLVTQDENIEIECQTISEKDINISQKYVRWDWIKNLMNMIPDQPIILDIKKKKVKVIFEY